MRMQGTIAEADLGLFLVTDSIEEAIALIKEEGIKKHGLKFEEKIKPFRWLFESKFKF
jgi:hypothetical protein